jgi:hypothetical protein
MIGRSSEIDRGSNAMQIFSVQLEDRPGTFAELTESLASRGVNVLVYGAGGSQAAFVCDDEDGARAALEGAGTPFDENEAIRVRMEDKPGQAAAVSRKLADAGVNMRAWLPVDTTASSFTVAIAADDAERARAALRNQLAE